MHLDLWGPCSITAYNGSRYFLIIVEDLSRCTWTYMLKNKSKTKACIQSFTALVEIQFATTMKIFRNDNGPEFHLPDFYSHKGIIHQKSCVKTSQQIEIVERKHQHLLQVVRALRLQSEFQSGSPLKFLIDYIMTATYLINRIPTPLLKNRSPFQVLFGHTLSYHHLRIFWCLAFATTLTHGCKKFDPRSTPSIFIGYPYGTKGYKLLDLHTYTPFISRHVVFHETTFPLHTPTS